MAELSKEQQGDGAQSNQNHRSRSGLLMGLGVIFILLSLGGLIFYLDLQQNERQKELSQKLTTELTQKDQQVMELTQQISGYQTQIAAIQSQLANVQQDSSGKDTHFNQALDDFSKLYTEKLEVTRTELKSSIDQVHRLLGKTRSDWLIADAEYLLSVANERLQLIGDVVTAKQALESADTRLRESEDVAVYKVREQLVKEIEALSKIKPLDVVGIYAKINALQQAANQLTLFLPYSGKREDTAGTAATQTAVDPEKGWLDNALHDMKGYVSIRHSSKPVKGIIGREEVQFIIQQLNVRLELVKMALLQQNEELYLAGILDTKQWLIENFTMDVRGNNFSKQLDELQAIKIRSQLPVISESLKLLKDITKLRIDTDKVLPKSPLPEPAKAVNNSAEKPAAPAELSPPEASPSAVPKPESAPAITPAHADEKTVAPVTQAVPLPVKQ